MPNRTLLIAGNWKMNKTSAEGAELAKAIVSAAGKSTAVELLSGNLSGYEGCMWLRPGNIGNNPTQRYQIADLSIESLTREIAIVAAQSHLFAGTLRDNLLMAKPNAKLGLVFLDVRRAADAIGRILG